MSSKPVDNVTDLIGDIIALRTIVQRLYAISALQNGVGNEWLDEERAALLSVLEGTTLNVNNSPKESAAVKARAEFTVNLVFDNVRVSYK